MPARRKRETRTVALVSFYVGRGEFIPVVCVGLAAASSSGEARCGE